MRGGGLTVPLRRFLRRSPPLNGLSPQSGDAKSQKWGHGETLSCTVFSVSESPPPFFVGTGFFFVSDGVKRLKSPMSPDFSRYKSWNLRACFFLRRGPGQDDPPPLARRRSLTVQARARAGGLRAGPGTVGQGDPLKRGGPRLGHAGHGGPRQRVEVKQETPSRTGFFWWVV